MNSDALEKFDYLIKIVLIGDANVGKTNILSRLVNGKFSENSKPTIGVEFGSKVFRFNKDLVKVQIWDTAGQERYHAITSAYYRGSAGSVLVYDVTNPKSLENIKTTWLRNLISVVDKSIPKMLLGNKSDLEDQRKVQKDSGKGLAISENMTFFETSALSGENIDVAFEDFVKKIYEIEKNNVESSAKRNKKDLNFKGTELRKNKKYSCC